MNKKTRPNDPCPCGSHKKFKKCCATGAKPSPSLKGLFRKKHEKLIKTADEIEGMRLAGRFNAELLQKTSEIIKPGITTLDINRFVHEYTLDHGHTPATLGYHGYPKSLCTSLNNVVCHGIPDETELKDGDIINIDVTSIVNGFHGDTNATYPVGEGVSEDALKLINTTRECLWQGIRQVKPGNSLYDVAAAIEDHAHAAGYSVVREYTGHGIGRKFHEEPQVLHYRTEAGKRFVFEPGMTFTIEPMINEGEWKTRQLNDGWTAVTIDGKLSAQFEHTVLVTEKGVEVLTELP